MNQEYMSLDWRRAPSASESIGRIQRFLTEADAQGGARVRGSSARGQVSLVERNGSPPVLLRVGSTSMRRGKAQVLYWARMISMALTITELLMDKQQVMARFVEYKEVSIITSEAEIQGELAFFGHVLLLHRTAVRLVLDVELMVNRSTLVPA